MASPALSPSWGRRGPHPTSPCPLPTAGFIDFIVEPTFSVLTDVAEKMVLPQNEDGSKAKGNAAGGQQARLGASSHPPSIRRARLRGCASVSPFPERWGSALRGEPIALGMWGRVGWG